MTVRSYFNNEAQELLLHLCYINGKLNECSIHIYFPLSITKSRLKPHLPQPSKLRVIKGRIVHSNGDDVTYGPESARLYS